MKLKYFQLTLFLLIFVPTLSQAVKLEDAIMAVWAPDLGKVVGTGILVGRDNQALYILTAKHVVSAYFNQSVTLYAKQSEDIIFSANVLNLDDIINDARLDLAVLKIDLATKDNKLNAKFLGSQKLIATTISRKYLFECDQGEEMRALGYPHGVVVTHAIKTTLQSTEYDGDKEFFTVGANSIEGGISGAPVINSSDEMSGIVLKITSDKRTAKVVSMASIEAFLKQHNIPMNLLRNASFVGRWHLKGVSLNQHRAAQINEGYLHLHSSGRSEGLANGNYCVRDNNVLSFYLSGVPVSISIPDKNNMTTSRAIYDKTQCDVRVASQAIMSLTCKSQFGDVNYQLVKEEGEL